MKNDDGRHTVLVVDDVPENLDVLNGILSSQYRVKVALDGDRALRVATSNPPPDVILLDVMMPGMDGFEVCRRLKEDMRTRDIPVIFVTARSEIEDETLGFSLGAVDYIKKPVSPPIVRARVQTHLALRDQNLTLEEKVLQRTGELRETRLEIVRCLGRAAEFRDHETGMHIMRMSHYSYLLARAAGAGERMCDLLLAAAPMHDVGKIGIPDLILLKADRLTPHERQVMESHTTIGASIIGEHEFELLRMARTVALTHHERWDGKGYPWGVAGEDIPFVGRVVSLADVFDALTSWRPYKDAWSVERSVEYVKSHAGKRFDPELVTLFQEVLPDMLEIMDRYCEE